MMSNLSSRKTCTEKFNEALEFLEKNNMMYKVENVHCSKIFVHKANRGGMGLHPHNVQRMGSRIFKVGADSKQLMNA
eukprot:5173209-Karenia_brevis.AAC.1